MQTLKDLNIVRIDNDTGEVRFAPSFEITEKSPPFLRDFLFYNNFYYKNEPSNPAEILFWDDKIEIKFNLNGLDVNTFKIVKFDNILYINNDAPNSLEASSPRTVKLSKMHKVFQPWSCRLPSLTTTIESEYKKGILTIVINLSLDKIIPEVEEISIKTPDIDEMCLVFNQLIEEMKKSIESKNNKLLKIDNYVKDFSKNALEAYSEIIKTEKRPTPF